MKGTGKFIQGERESRKENERAGHIGRQKGKKKETITTYVLDQRCMSILLLLLGICSAG